MDTSSVFLAGVLVGLAMRDVWRVYVIPNRRR